MGKGFTKNLSYKAGSKIPGRGSKLRNPYLRMRKKIVLFVPTPKGLFKRNVTPKIYIFDPPPFLLCDNP